MIGTSKMMGMSDGSPFLDEARADRVYLERLRSESKLITADL